MGREVKRVPLDFDWPMKERWPGYLMSFCSSLESCGKCQHFAKLQGLEIADYGCPVFAYLNPPTGEGFQLWETTSEGSPISPVFATPEELARWLTDNNASAFGHMTLPYEKWLAFIEAGEPAPSAVLDDRGFRSGVEMVGEKIKVLTAEGNQLLSLTGWEAAEIDAIVAKRYGVQPGGSPHNWCVVEEKEK